MKNIENLISGLSLCLLKKNLPNVHFCIPDPTIFEELNEYNIRPAFSVPSFIFSLWTLGFLYVYNDENLNLPELILLNFEDENYGLLSLTSSVRPRVALTILKISLPVSRSFVLYISRLRYMPPGTQSLSRMSKSFASSLGLHFS